MTALSTSLSLGGLDLSFTQPTPVTCFKKGKVLALPLFQFGSPVIDDSILKSPHSLFLKKTAAWLIKNKVVSAKTEREFYDEMNERMKGGGCNGECQALVLAPNDRFEQRILATVLQAEAKIAGNIQIVINNCQDEIQQLYTRYKELQKGGWTSEETEIVEKMEALGKNVEQLKSILAVCDAFKANLYAAKGLQHETSTTKIELTSETEFQQKIKTALDEIFKEKTVIAVQASVRFQDERGHSILLQPNEGRIHEPNYGYFGLQGKEQLVQTFMSYCQQEKVVSLYFDPIRTEADHHVISVENISFGDIQGAEVALRDGTAAIGLRNTCIQFLQQQLQALPRKSEKEVESFYTSIRCFSQTAGFEGVNKKIAIYKVQRKLQDLKPVITDVKNQFQELMAEVQDSLSKIAIKVLASKS